MGSDPDIFLPVSNGRISIHAPRMGSDTDDIRYSFWLEISIHAPRMGSDGIPYITNGRAFSISIHAPRMGSDLLHGGLNNEQPYFNPRSPHGERRCGLPRTHGRS